MIANISRLMMVASITAVLLSGAANLCRAEATLTIGSVGSNPQKEISTFTPLMEYLENKLGVQTNIVVLENTDQMISAIKNKNVDFFMDSPFPAAKVCDNSGARFVLRHWKKGVSEYSGAIFSRSKDVKSLDELKGKLVAFEDPDSTSSYLLPMLLLKEANLKTTQKSSFRDKASNDEIGYVFSKDDENTLLWVSKKRVAAGGIKTQEVAGQAKYKILAESPMVPRAVVSFAPHMTEKLSQALEAALFNMKSDPAAAQALSVLSNTTQFDKFPRSAPTVQQDMISYTQILGY